RQALRRGALRQAAEGLALGWLRSARGAFRADPGGRAAVSRGLAAHLLEGGRGDGAREVPPCVRVRDARQRPVVCALSSPTARTLAWLREQGWDADVVERWVPGAKVRRDFLGFADILAIRGEATLAV